MDTQAGDAPTKTTGLRRLDDGERQLLLMYLLGKSRQIRSYTRFNGTVALIEQKLRSCGYTFGYSFKDDYLLVSDDKLDADLRYLRGRRYVKNDPFQDDITHDIELLPEGKRHLRAVEAKRSLGLVLDSPTNRRLLADLRRIWKESMKKDPRVHMQDADQTVRLLRSTTV